MLLLSTITDKTKMIVQTEEEFGTSFLRSGSMLQLFPNASFIRELDTPYGRPDVVLFDTKPDSRRSIMAAMHLSPSTTSFAAVFFALKEAGNYVDQNQLAAHTGLSLPYVRSVVRSMLQHGLVTEKRSGYKLSQKARIPQTTIVSIEFKLHDWRKALQQAVRHLAFADRAFVVMPANKRDLLISKRQLFSSFGISVAVYDAETYDFEVLSEESQPSVSEVTRIDLVSRIWVNRELIGQI